MIKAIFFDVGGVLEVAPATDWRQRWSRRLGRRLAEFQVLLDELWTPGATGAQTLAEIERRTAKALCLDAEALKELMHDAWTEYLGTLNDELAEVVRGLQPRYLTGTISNSFVGAREREQAAYGFENLFDVLVYSHEVGCLKPDPRIYRLACEQLDVLPAEAVLVDDLEANVRGARALGMAAIHYTDNAQTIGELHAITT